MKMRNCRIIMKKELKSLYNEKTIIFAILLQLFIAMFSSFLIVGLASMYDPESLSRYSTTKYPIGYAGDASPLLTGLEESSDFVVYRMELSTAVAALKERKLSAVVWAPDTATDSEYPVKITLYSIQNDIQSTVVTTKLKALFLSYEEMLREVRSDRLNVLPVPLNLPSSTTGSDFYEFVYGLLIPLLIFMPAIISSALIIDLITEEFQHETLETLLSTPMTFSEMIWGKVLACFVLVPLQSGAWLLLLMINGIAIQGAIPMLLHVCAGSLALILLGTLTALYYRDRTNAQFIFSTALVVVILFTLAIPGNQVNLLVRLSVGAVGSEHWIILGLVTAVTVLLGIVTTLYAERVKNYIFTVR